jgi:hypothetical protein
MSTRAAAAANSSRAKRELVRLLFSSQYARRGGPEAHRKLDPHGYSFSDLKKAYLERLQAIHPDKHKAGVDDKKDSDELHSRFVELQTAWNNYEQVAKTMHKVGQGKDANFTMFGVGCSFSDSPEERALRHEITEQACRGWFSAGQIAETSTFEQQEQTQSQLSTPPISLVDHDDLFVEDTSCRTKNVAEESADNDTQAKDAKPKPSLVGNFRPRRRREHVERGTVQASIQKL